MNTESEGRTRKKIKDGDINFLGFVPSTVTGFFP
jgi:hypothetical protein